MTDKPHLERAMEVITRRQAGIAHTCPGEERGLQDSMRANVYAEACPSRAILELIADKWTLLILPALEKGAMRNGELMRLIGGVSQKMLTQTLRELERNGLVRRIDHKEVPPRVEYALTALGLSLSHAVRALDTWAESHISDVLAAREAYERQEAEAR